MTEIEIEDAPVETTDGQDQDAAGIEDEVVIEEVFIDGMCGVY